MNNYNPLIYIAAPLFSEAERAFNERIDDTARAQGFRTFLPQRDGGNAIKLMDAGEPAEVVRPRLFNLDWQNVQACDLLLMILDGRVPDEGSCVELGMAYALRKPCIGFQTDTRRFARGFNNVMIEGSLSAIAETWDELRALLIEAKNIS